MRVGRFVHPSPLPQRSYWALWEGEQARVVFSLGEGNVVVEQPLGVVELSTLMQWLAEAVPALEWEQVTIACTLLCETVAQFGQPVVPVTKASAKRKPRRKPRYQTVIQKLLTPKRKRR